MKLDINYIVIFNTEKGKNPLVVEETGSIPTFKKFEYANQIGESFVDDCEADSHEVYVKCNEELASMLAGMLEEPDEKTEHCQGICSIKKIDCFCYDNASTDGKCMTTQNKCEHRKFIY